MTFEELLNSSLDIGLFITTSMVFFLTIMESADLSSFVCWFIFAFLFPIEFKVYVSRCGGDWVLIVDKFDD